MSEAGKHIYILEVSHQPDAATGASPRIVVVTSPVPFKPRDDDHGYDELEQVVFEKVVQEHVSSNVECRTRSFDEYFERNIKRRADEARQWSLFSSGLRSMVYVHPKNERIHVPKDHPLAKLGEPEYTALVSAASGVEYAEWHACREGLKHQHGQDRQSSLGDFVFHKLQRFPCMTIRYEPFLIESLLPITHTIDGIVVPYLHTFDSLVRDDQNAIMEKAVLGYRLPELLKKWVADENTRRTNPELPPAHVNDTGRPVEDIESRVGAKHAFIEALWTVCGRDDLVEMGQALSVIPRTSTALKDGVMETHVRSATLLEMLMHTRSVHVPGEIPRN